MSGRTDAGRAVDVEPDVSLLGELWLTGVDAHPHRQLEPRLSLLYRSDRI